MKPQLLNKGEIEITLNLLKKIEHNLQLNHEEKFRFPSSVITNHDYEEQTTDYELFCAVEVLLAYLEK